ncbi:hypothetical protein ACEXQB_012180 [Herbiconiux sp. P18]|uniref:hypothetical protein n=1 Tax=Herbiconiux liangxiaofengii TaxID=3342795 RepID=UPI0035B8CE7A
MFGLTIEKLLVIVVIAAFLIGPERLPLYAAKLTSFVRAVRDLTESAKARVTEELGPDFDPAEWKRLDPRQYDPRRIVRDALTADDEPAADEPAAVEPAAVEPAARDSAAVDPDVDTPKPLVAAGGWQEAMLARVGPGAGRST